MRVANLIQRLKEGYEPDEHLIVTYWSREDFSPEITDDQWPELAKKADNLDFSDMLFHI